MGSLPKTRIIAWRIAGSLSTIRTRNCCIVILREAYEFREEADPF